MEELKLSEINDLSLLCDNKATISMVHNPVQHDRTKHIEIDRQFIKEKIVNGSLSVSDVTSKEQLADVFTKGLSSRLFHTLVCKLGMCNIHEPT